MMVRRCLGMATIGIGALTLSSEARSQDFPVMDWGPMMQSVAMGSAMRHASGATKTPSTQRSITAIRSIDFSYRPSTQQRKKNLAQFVEKTRRSNPDSAAKMQGLFASTDVIALMGQALAPVGLRTDNVADAYAVWWMSAWGAAHGDSSTPGRAKAQAVREQAGRAISATPEFASASNESKQEFAEALLVQAALIDSMVEEYGRDPAMAAKIASSVRQGARASGLDLDAMTLTEQGFVPATKTGSVDPTSGEPKALAALSDGDSGPSYGVLALAGGTGLGAAFLLGKVMGRRG